MAQLFHRSANSLARMSLLAVLFFAASAGLVLAELQRSAYVTRQYEPRVQTPPFSHQHHVGGLGIDCRYCHTSVEQSSFAGIPPTKTCMNCHAQIWTSAPMLEPVRESYRSGRSLSWVRVHDLPDFVYFDHSIHVNKGIGCQSCHGQVDNMPLMLEQNSLQMEWCLDCHRNPAKYIRPRTVQTNVLTDKNGHIVDEGLIKEDTIFDMKYAQPSRDVTVYTRLSDGKVHAFNNQTAMGKALVKEYHVREVPEITSCNTCHR